jgi:hypothetical protein
MLPYILDQIFAHDPVSNTSYYIAAEASMGENGRKFPTWENVPTTLLALSPAGLRINRFPSPTAPINSIAFDPSTKVWDIHAVTHSSQILFLVSSRGQTLFALMIVPAGAQFQLALATLDPTSGKMVTLVSSAPQDTFINYQWMAGDWKARSLSRYFFICSHSPYSVMLPLTNFPDCRQALRVDGR